MHTLLTLTERGSIDNKCNPFNVHTQVNATYAISSPKHLSINQ
uniref:Uncharacterized protein n=1 Tax=Amphimedon queenslandica TaxID=400682 RepID=A0A1X7TUV5_AMPQE